MRILVTGASGFLGTSVIPNLVKRGHEIVALARSESAADKVSSLGATPVIGDLDDPVSLDSSFASGADALANLASLGFGHALPIVAAAEEAGIGRTVFVSTTSIFSNLPTSSRGVRLTAEETIKSSGLRWTIVRPTMIYGRPDDRNMARLLSLIRHSPVVPIPGGGSRLIQPVHVDDLAEFISIAIESDETVGKTFNVAGPDPLSLREVVDIAATALGRTPRVIRVPLGPAVVAVRIYGLLSANPRLKVEQILRLDEDKAFDISAAQSLGYSPRSFAEGIQLEAEMVR